MKQVASPVIAAMVPINETTEFGSDGATTCPFEGDGCGGERGHNSWTVWRYEDTLYSGQHPSTSTDVLPSGHAAAKFCQV